MWATSIVVSLKNVFLFFLVFGSGPPPLSRRYKQTSKKGLESISPSSDLTCFIPSKAGPNTVPSILKIDITAIFNPVVGGGPNGSVVHYSRNDQKVKDGDLVLMDIGCELHGYVSDLTRTWPPCGRFSDFQKELYHLILETNKECIELCKPGTSIQCIHKYSMLEIGAYVDSKPKSDEATEDTDFEVSDISFEELLAQEKKDSFWQKKVKPRSGSD